MGDDKKLFDDEELWEGYDDDVNGLYEIKWIFSRYSNCVTNIF